MSAITRLLMIMQQLRDPLKGCPWDVAQDFASIAPYTIEEAYEVADAVERQDMSALKEELGDLLLQVVFHAQMADEAKLFDFEAVAEAIGQKMVERHPHVFGTATIASAEEQTEAWERMKAEKRQQTQASQSAMDGVTLGLPALMRAEKLQKRAARTGFDWPDIAQVWHKLDEERLELLQAETPEEQAEELGDMLFVMANLARYMKLDAEQALAQANKKFERRFRQMEAIAKEQGKDFDGLTLDEQEKLWQLAKRSV